MKVIPVILSATILVSPMVVPMTAQAQPAQISQVFPALAGVNLSEAQISQMEQLRAQTRSQVNAIVSPQQRQNFFGELQAGNGLKDAIAAANLSDSQRTQVRGILGQSRQEAAQILTVQQRRQLLKNIRARLLGQS